MRMLKQFIEWLRGPEYSLSFRNPVSWYVNHRGFAIGIAYSEEEAKKIVEAHKRPVPKL